MVAEQEDVFYYLTLMNENYQHPAMPEGAEEGILRGMYLLRDGAGRDRRSRACSCSAPGTILREVLAGADLLEQDFGVTADVWSVTSFTELRRDGIEVERFNTLTRSQEARVAYVTEQLAERRGPGDRIDRLHPRLRGPDPAVGSGRVSRARDRWLRPQRLPQGVAQLLRSRPPPRRGRGAQALADDGSAASSAPDAIKRYEIDAAAPMPTHG